MLTSEQVVADWLDIPWTDIAVDDFHLRPLIDAIRVYGDQRAAAERERCAQIAERTYTGYTAVGDLVPAGKVIAQAIRAAPPATPDPR